MRIAVTTPSGHVGSAVADFLLDRGDVEVKLLGRRPNTLAGLVRRGAEMAIGSQDDAEYLTKATEGVDALLWVTPPGFGSDDLRAFQNRFGKAAATAIRTNRIPRVVNLSSIGAERNAGVGPINGLHDVERLMDDVAASITHLRPGFFFENLLMQRDAIGKWGRISLPVSGSRPVVMIATRDVGRVAADLLTSRDWSGYGVRELHGPAELSFDEAAEILSEVLGRKITYVRCDRQEARQSLISAGISENGADLMLEMYDAAEAGGLRPLQPRSKETTTPTTLAEFARDVLLPSLAMPVRH
jgi:uncharacterized protein YbjT (DUF2867 family)